METESRHFYHYLISKFAFSIR